MFINVTKHLKIGVQAVNLTNDVDRRRCSNIPQTGLLGRRVPIS